MINSGEAPFSRRSFSYRGLTPRKITSMLGATCTGVAEPVGIVW